VCDVEELVVTPPDKSIRCEQNEYHGNTSHISGNSARSGKKMNIIGCEKASSVHTSTLVSDLWTEIKRIIDYDVRSVHCH